MRCPWNRSFFVFRVLRAYTKNSKYKFTGKYQGFHYTFLFNAYDNLRDGLPYPYTEQDGKDFIVCIMGLKPSP